MSTYNYLPVLLYLPSTYCRIDVLIISCRLRHVELAQFKLIWVGLDRTGALNLQVMYFGSKGG